MSQIFPTLGTIMLNKVYKNHHYCKICFTYCAVYCFIWKNSCRFYTVSINLCSILLFVVSNMLYIIGKLPIMSSF